MIQNFGRGPIIVMVRGTRIALGRGEAAHVRIQPNGDRNGEAA
jgi:Fe2+ transport system protein FeoA